MHKSGLVTLGSLFIEWSRPKINSACFFPTTKGSFGWLSNFYTFIRRDESYYSCLVWKKLTFWNVTSCIVLTSKHVGCALLLGYQKSLSFSVILHQWRNNFCHGHIMEKLKKNFKEVTLSGSHQLQEQDFFFSCLGLFGRSSLNKSIESSSDLLREYAFLETQLISCHLAR